jgi:hypothetical protein
MDQLLSFDDRAVIKKAYTSNLLTGSTRIKRRLQCPVLHSRKLAGRELLTSSLVVLFYSRCKEERVQHSVIGALRTRADLD